MTLIFHGQYHEAWYFDDSYLKFVPQVLDKYGSVDEPVKYIIVYCNWEYISAQKIVYFVHHTKKTQKQQLPINKSEMSRCRQSKNWHC